MCKKTSKTQMVLNQKKWKITHLKLVFKVLFYDHQIEIFFHFFFSVSILHVLVIPFHFPLSLWPFWNEQHGHKSFWAELLTPFRTSRSKTLFKTRLLTPSSSADVSKLKPRIHPQCSLSHFPCLIILTFTFSALAHFLTHHIPNSCTHQSPSQWRNALGLNFCWPAPYCTAQSGVQCIVCLSRHWFHKEKGSYFYSTTILHNWVIL